MQLNNQPIEKRLNHDGQVLDVHSIFYTIQGEGPFCGQPAVFVRLAGCNLQCPLCDTEYTQGRQQMSVSDIYTTVRGLTPPGLHDPLVVITGGEPFRQNLKPICDELSDNGFRVQIETNGTLPPSPGIKFNTWIRAKDGIFVVCSPKAGRVHDDIWAVACCAKYVLKAGHVREEDGLPTHALNHSANPFVARPPDLFKLMRPIYLQPADEKDEAANTANVSAVLKSCMTHGYTLQLQIHKHIGVE